MSFSSGGAPALTCFTNCHLCISGELIPQDLYFSPETGLITPNYYYRAEGVERIDLNGAIVAPGFLDLQTNGMKGIHFTSLTDKVNVDSKLHKIASCEVECGVTGFWATLPTVAPTAWKEILLSLTPRSFENAATLLGVHCEGPYLHPSKKGAHNESYFQEPTSSPPEDLYLQTFLDSTIKIITLAPEQPGSITLIGHLRENYPHLVISLGHSSATYEIGLAALEMGATSLTHVFNAMSPLHHRDPGLPGLMATGKCYYTVIPDGIHLHPATLTIAFRNDPTRCIIISDSVELAGLPDGVHPGHGQIQYQQLKSGNKVTINGTETLVGSCCSLDQCIRNMVDMTRCTLAEAVRCATENVAALMKENKRGILEAGRRADFAILDSSGFVKETWMDGMKVWDSKT